MHKTLASRIEEAHLTFRHLCWLLPRTRSVVRDQAGTWYWYLEECDPFSHREIHLLRFPSLTDLSYHRNHAGSAIFSPQDQQQSHIWMLWSVRIDKRYRKRGLGTLLVHAVIRRAKLAGAQELQAEVAFNDANTQPFLLPWYEQLGFTIAPVPLPDPLPIITTGLIVARLSMRLENQRDKQI